MSGDQVLDDLQAAFEEAGISQRDMWTNEEVEDQLSYWRELYCDCPEEDRADARNEIDELQAYLDRRRAYGILEGGRVVDLAEFIYV